MISTKNKPWLVLVDFWLVASSQLRNISQIGSFPQVGVKIKMFETTTLIVVDDKPLVDNKPLIFDNFRGSCAPEILRIQYSQLQILRRSANGKG